MTVKFIGIDFAKEGDKSAEVSGYFDNDGKFHIQNIWVENAQIELTRQPDGSYRLSPHLANHNPG